MAAVHATAPLANGLQPLSCLRCARRKVRCDRLVPCGNCIRHDTPCEFPEPKTERRQRKRVALSSSSASSSRSRPTQRAETRGNVGRPASLDLSTPMSPQDNVGSSNESNGMADAYCSSYDGCPGEYDTIVASNESTAFPFGTRNATHSMKNAYPPHQHFSVLWRTYLTNVQPLTMILHAPTAGEVLTEALGQRYQQIPETQALLFAMSACAVVSMTPSDCLKLLGQKQTELFAAYRAACETALIRAKFFASSNPIVVQAYTIYLLAISPYTEPCELWNLTGIARRSAQRLGYHSKTLQIGLSPFNREMCRRLWLNIVVLDVTAAQAAGLPCSEPLDDVCLPSNINDSDLSSTSVKVPAECPGVTDMLFTLLRFKSICILKKVDGGMKPWCLSTDNFAQDSAFRTERVQIIADFENELELDFLRYCDMLNPVHFLAVLTARLTICQLRFKALSLDQCGSTLSERSDEEKLILFSTAVKVLEYENNIRGQSFIQGLTWHRNKLIPWSILRHILENLRTYTHGDVADKAWEQVHLFFESRPQLCQTPGSNDSSHLRMNQSVLAAWRARELDLAHLDQTERATPAYIKRLQGQFSQIAHKPNAQTRTVQPVDLSATLPANPFPSSDARMLLSPDASVGTYEQAQATIAWPDWTSLTMDTDVYASGNHLHVEMGDRDLMLEPFGN